MRWRICAVCLLVAACSIAGTDAPFQLAISPEIVQGLFPATPTMLLAEVTSESDEPVSLVADVVGGTATVEPADARPGEVVEVVVTADPGTEESLVTVSLLGTRGDTEESIVREMTMRPFEDTLEPTARQILAVFATWLEENRPDLGITIATEFEGVAVCPVLVVSHYMFLTDEWELGLSWHIMVAPDDWSELYLRARDEMTPASAFRLVSWSTALNEGTVEIEEVAAPAEITR